MQRRPRSTRARVGTTGEAVYPARVTTYTLRGASPAKTRADAVVVGLVQSRSTVEVAAGRRGRRRRRTAASCGRCWPRSASPARRARSPRCPPAGTIASPLLVLVGLGRKADVDQVAVRRAAGAAARAVTNAASVALALPADSPELVRAVDRGLPPRRLHLHDVQEGVHAPTHPARWWCSARTPASTRRSPPSRRPRCVADAVAATRDWVNTPAGRPAAARLRRRGARRRQGARQGPGAQGQRQGPRRGVARRARLRRHPRRRPRAPTPRRGWSSSPTPRGRGRAPRPGRQGHHLRLRRPDDQARRRA